MNNKKKILLFLLIIFVNQYSFPQNELSVLRVMTYNLRYANENPGEEWSKRKDKVISIIELANPDIIGVQEALKIQLDDLISELKNYEVIGVGRDDGKNSGEFSAILFNKKKLNVIKENTFWLSETPDVPSKGWDAALPRICTWAEFNFKGSEKSFYLFNTHFDHIGIQARNNSAKLLLGKIKDTNSKVILTGDFNSNDTSDVYKILTAIKSNDNKFFLIDTRKISKNGCYGSNLTFNDFGKSIIEGSIIDFIFVTPEMQVKNHYTLGEKIDNYFPSDHNPVIVDIEIQ